MNHPRTAGSRWQRVLASLLLAGGLLAACGGGSSQFDPFVAKRVFAFGDENSTLTSTPAGNGLKYGVNGLDAAGAIDCRVDPIWVQAVATLYGFVFAECNRDGVAEPRARMYAADGSKVADVATQVEAARIAAGGYQDKDLATVMAGGNDILEIYSRFPATAESDLIADAKARGLQLAGSVNRLVELGAKVVVSDVPDMGLTPYAAKQDLAFPGTDRIGLLTRLTSAFNEQLGVNVVLDGRYVGLVQADLYFRAIRRSPTSFGLSDSTTAVCTVAPPNCTTSTLITGAAAAEYLWADDTRFAVGGQNQLASLATDRARRNPF